MRQQWRLKASQRGATFVHCTQGAPCSLISFRASVLSERDSDEEEYRQILKRCAELRVRRRAAQALALEVALPEYEPDLGPRIEDEEVASQVLTSMLLVCFSILYTRCSPSLTWLQARQSQTEAPQRYFVTISGLFRF
jgi:hypothetical protein